MQATTKLLWGGVPT